MISGTFAGPKVFQKVSGDFKKLSGRLKGVSGAPRLYLEVSGSFQGSEEVSGGCRCQRLFPLLDNKNEVLIIGIY